MDQLQADINNMSQTSDNTCSGLSRVIPTDYKDNKNDLVKAGKLLEKKTDQGLKDTLTSGYQSCSIDSNSDANKASWDTRTETWDITTQAWTTAEDASPGGNSNLVISASAGSQDSAELKGDSGVVNDAHSLETDHTSNLSQGLESVNTQEQIRDTSNVVENKNLENEDMTDVFVDASQTLNSPDTFIPSDTQPDTPPPPYPQTETMSMMTEDSVIAHHLPTDGALDYHHLPPPPAEMLLPPGEDTEPSVVPPCGHVGKLRLTSINEKEEENVTLEEELKPGESNPGQPGATCHGINNQSDEPLLDNRDDPNKSTTDQNLKETDPTRRANLEDAITTDGTPVDHPEEMKPKGISLESNNISEPIPFPKPSKEPFLPDQTSEGEITQAAVPEDPAVTRHQDPADVHNVTKSTGTQDPNIAQRTLPEDDSPGEPVLPDGSHEQSPSTPSTVVDLLECANQMMTDAMESLEENNNDPDIGQVVNQDTPQDDDHDATPSVSDDKPGTEPPIRAEDPGLEDVIDVPVVNEGQGTDNLKSLSEAGDQSQDTDNVPLKGSDIKGAVVKSEVQNMDSQTKSEDELKSKAEPFSTDLHITEEMSTTENTEPQLAALRLHETMDSTAKVTELSLNARAQNSQVQLRAKVLKQQHNEAIQKDASSVMTQKDASSVMTQKDASSAKMHAECEQKDESTPYDSSTKTSQSSIETQNNENGISHSGVKITEESSTTDLACIKPPPRKHPSKPPTITVTYAPGADDPSPPDSCLRSSDDWQKELEELMKPFDSDVSFEELSDISSDVASEASRRDTTTTSSNLSNDGSWDSGTLEARLEEDRLALESKDTSERMVLERNDTSEADGAPVKSSPDKDKDGKDRVQESSFHDHFITKHKFYTQKSLDSASKSAVFANGPVINSTTYHATACVHYTITKEKQIPSSEVPVTGSDLTGSDSDSSDDSDAYFPHRLSRSASDIDQISHLYDNRPMTRDMWKVIFDVSEENINRLINQCSASENVKNTEDEKNLDLSQEASQPTEIDESRESSIELQVTKDEFVLVNRPPPDAKCLMDPSEAEHLDNDSQPRSNKPSEDSDYEASFTEEWDDLYVTESSDTGPEQTVAPPLLQQAEEAPPGESTQHYTQRSALARSAPESSTTSFTGAAGPGAPSRAPIDRDKAPLPNPARVQPVKPRPANDSPPPTEPISIPVTSANGTAHNIAASLPVGGGALSGDREETEALRKEVTLLRKELTKCRETIRKLEERENSMKERLSEQAIRGLEKGSTKFEDLNLGDNRPTQLIRRYGNLYSETRLDAFDALEDLPEIADFDDLKGKLLFSVVVLAFRSVQRSLSDTRSKIRALLCLPPADAKTSFSREPIVRQLEDTISVYLRKFVSKYDCSTNVQNPLHDLTEEVCQQVWSTLYDYPSLKECSGLKQYIDECVKLAWALSVQNPPLTIDYEIKVFHEDVHTRFHTSDPESETIKSILWPSLREGEKGPCVFKGVVVT